MKRFHIFNLVICISVILVSCLSGIALGAKKESSKEFGIVGIDVSRHQGKIDFEKVKVAGIRYVFIRATDGITYQDPNFKTNFDSAHAAGITIGAYHFYETNDDPIAQLRNFTSVVALKPGDLPPVIDIERLHNQDEVKLSENLQTFLHGCEKHYGVKPIIYSGHNFSNKYLTGFGGYPLWIAEYQVDELKLPTGWDDWDFWQWSQSHTIPGIHGDVDANRYNGEEDRFMNMLIK